MSWEPDDRMYGPIELPELTVYSKKPKWWESALNRAYNTFVTENPLFSNTRVANYRRAISRNNRFDDTWGSLNPIFDRDRYALSNAIMENLRLANLHASVGNPDVINEHQVRFLDEDPKLINEPIIGDAQATYLLGRELLRKYFLDHGYTEAPLVKNENGELVKDYGRVRSAVGDRDLPVYLKFKDDDEMTRELLIPIYNPDNMFIHSSEAIDTEGKTDWQQKKLTHAGNYPLAIYINPNTGNLYYKGWDLNDYSISSAGSSGFATNYGPIRKYVSELLDNIGSPVVVTTGFKRVENEPRFEGDMIISNEIHSLLDSYEGKLNGFDQYAGDYIPEQGLPYLLRLKEYLDFYGDSGRITYSTNPSIPLNEYLRTGLNLYNKQTYNDVYEYRKRLLEEFGLDGYNMLYKSNPYFRELLK